jgi:uncharacterized protein YqfA (UPF0365 family)
MDKSKNTVTIKIIIIIILILFIFLVFVMLGLSDACANVIAMGRLCRIDTFSISSRM